MVKVGAGVSGLNRVLPEEGMLLLEVVLGVGRK